MQLLIQPDGNVTCLWQEDIDLNAIGTLRVERASTVEFNQHTGLWEVCFPERPGLPAYASTSRNDCLAWEHDEVNRRLGGETADPDYCITCCSCGHRWHFAHGTACNCHTAEIDTLDTL